MTVINSNIFSYKDYYLDPNCEEPFFETFDDFEENGYPLSLGMGPSVCFFRNITGQFRFNLTVTITTPNATAFKALMKWDLTDADSLYTIEQFVLLLEYKNTKF